MNPRVKVFLIFFCCLSWKLKAQVEHHLLHPTLFDELLDYQVLNDSIIRIFALSDQNNGWVNQALFYADFRNDLPLEDVEPVKINGPGSGVNYENIKDAFLLKLSDGSVIIAHNYEGCDIQSPEAIFRMTPEGEIDWVISNEDGHFGGLFNKLVFADAETIFVGMQGSHIFVNLNGSVVSGEKLPLGITTSIGTSEGVLVGSSNGLYRCNPIIGCSLLQFLDGQIERILQMGSGTFLVITTSTFYKLQNDNLTHLPLSAQEYYSVWEAGDFYWAMPVSGGGIVQLDAFFNELQFHTMTNGVLPFVLYPVNDKVYVIGNYKTPLTESVIFFRGQKKNSGFAIHQNIGITAISIPDSVVVERISLPYNDGPWYYTYKSVTVEVTNFGLDTIYEFFIQGQDISQCYAWCSFSWPLWKIDSIVLPPGKRIDIVLGPFQIKCINMQHNTLCLSAIAPNEKADGYFLDDGHCQDFSFLLNVDESLNEVFINFYPNPADDILIFHGSGAGYLSLTAEIVNTNGIVMDKITCNSQEKEIILSNYPAGIYFIRLIDQENRIDFRKLVITH